VDERSGAAKISDALPAQEVKSEKESIKRASLARFFISTAAPKCDILGAPSNLESPISNL
jgi:hypothetical protein